MQPLPILMYHKIESPACPVPREEESRYAVVLEDFKWQLECIGREGMRAVTVRQALDALKKGEPLAHLVVMTFDDGNRSDYVHVLPCLRESGFAATFFVCMNRVGKDDGLDAEMIKELNASSMEIGSHGMTHRFLTALSGDEQVAECRGSKEALSGIIGADVVSFAPPGGRVNDKVRSILESASYKAVCTSRFGFVGAGSNFFSMRRIPIMRNTKREAFRSIIRRQRKKLFPLYFRSEMLHFSRLLLGERIYKEARSRLLGK